MVPNSWKWRWATRAIQLAAESAPNGKSHCAGPVIPLPARSTPIPARPPLPWAVASVTVRYTSTWRASPVATAMHAFTTAWSCAGPSWAPLCQSRRRRSASWASEVPGPEKPPAGVPPRSPG